MARSTRALTVAETADCCDTRGVAVHISAARDDLKGLEALAPLWAAWHRHHRELSEHPECWDDLDTSWLTRLDWYQGLLLEGASYVTATDDEGAVVGYAMLVVHDSRDDRVDVEKGIAEVATLVVTSDRRSAGVGRALLRAAEGIALDRGYDTVKVAVVSRNRRAQDFYEACGYALGEHVLYRSLGDR